MPNGSDKRRLIGGAVISLMIALLLSLGAIYGMNRYLDPVDDPPTSSLRHWPTN
jgi:hypothetical protein